MEKIAAKPFRSVLVLFATCMLLVALAPSTAMAEEQSQTVKSGWTRIICIVDKDSGGVGLGGYYGWKIVSSVTVTDGVVTDVEVIGRGEAMPKVPDTEKPYFEPCHFLMEEAIVDARINAADPAAVDAVDVVSGATSTSHWIKEATKEALQKWSANNETAKDIEAKIAAIAAAADKEAAVKAARDAYDAFEDASSYVSASAYSSLADAEKAVEAAAAAELDLSKGTVTLAKASYAYTGKPITLKATVKSKSGKTLVEGTDYTVAYTNAKGKAATPKAVGTYKAVVTGKGAYNGTKSASFKITQAAQPLTVKAKTPTIAAGKTVAASKVFTTSKAQGKLTYKNVSTNKTAKKFKVNASNGKVTVPKGTKKGTYQVKIKITAKGNANYKSGSKTVTVKVKVK